MKIEKNFEISIYNYWEKNNIFKNKNSNNNNYSMILPPPNITGKLHIGHTFQQTIMDFLIRFNKMNGKNVLWQPGLDHAGIATQILIEKKFNKENFKNNKKFLIKKTKSFKNELDISILNQMKSLGNFINWKNIRFTMDKDFKKSVKYAFIKLYNNQLIYKDKKIVNWDIKLKTAISDLEVSYKNITCDSFFIKYKLLNSNKNVIVFVNELEKILGTTAIVTNNIELFNSFKNNKAILPIVNRIIPIIFDKHVNESNGNFINLIPGHNINHFDLAIKHNLQIIDIFSNNGKIKKYIDIIDKNKKFIYIMKLPKILYNLNITNCRKKILDLLNSLNIIEKKISDKLNIPFNNRNNSYVIQKITDQWFIKTNTLLKNSINFIKNKKIKFIQKNYEKIYLKYISSMKDWCISRQIWWGHRIPAWYDKDKNIYVGKNKKDLFNKYNLNKNIKLYKDKNVLDTWFSSSIFSFASLGWPKKTLKFKLFHPTNIIITGYDIIFFWISRMIMMTSFLLKDEKNNIPFKKIYITGLINDKYGKKMSKSNNNVIDPINIINGKLLNNNKKNYYVIDSLRMTLLSLNNSKNINFNINNIYNYKNFCNKLWNSSLYIINNCKNIKKCNFYKIKIKLDINKWIIIELNEIIKNSIFFIKKYKFNIFINLIYNFFWHKFCDWYIEMTKFYFKKYKKKYINEIKNVLLFVIINIIKLLHPVIPFITEKIWILINNDIFLKKKNKSIIFQNINYKKITIDRDNILKKKIIYLQELIILTRKYIKKGKNIINYIVLNDKKYLYIIKKYKNIMIFLLKIDKIYINFKKKNIKNNYINIKI
ncbi:valine--tRNA ligase [endosymbiont of Euscepes postfasciatus]|uniref:valine--tRNA ligase n=1 Tax=endosymbiont of Euscepes postfasciatus TaxID=650377 RepID=UPI000DC70DA3|nr:valine--tRNA ligase [endosymbiont of Euscepes postfasciatus]BBA84612.1 valine--tRNA ligase [endosymbiont of Euscepes postfasciatus]